MFVKVVYEPSRTIPGEDQAACSIAITSLGASSGTVVDRAKPRRGQGLSRFLTAS